MFIKRDQSKPKLISIVIMIALSLTFLLIIGSYVEASEEGNRLASLIEGAKKEGKVVVYGATVLDEAMPLVKKFEEKYPFIKVEYVQATGEVGANRILTEARAGKYLADVFQGKLRAHTALKEKGLLAKYASPEHKFFDKRFIDPEGYWISQYLAIVVFVYNTNLVKPQEVPKSYEDLLDPKWKGEKIGIDFAGYEWFTALLEAMGREKGIAYMENLSKQEPVLRTNQTISVQLLAAGENPLATTYIHSVARMKRKGAPVDWARFDFPAPTNLTPVAILVKAPHSNTARLFYEYLISKDAQELLTTVGRNPARSGLQSGLPKDFKYFVNSESLYTDVMDRNMKEFDRIFKKKR